MSSNASSSGIESDADSNLSLNDDTVDEQSSDITNLNDDSLDTVHDDDDDEGFLNDDIIDKQPNTIFDSMNPCSKNSNNSEPSMSTSWKSTDAVHSPYPYSTQNPYDDDSSKSARTEDWDEECKVVEPYYFPCYIRRAQWPHHWRWTPPLGFRRTGTQQLHRNFGFERPGQYDDIDCPPSSLTLRHFTFDFH